MRAVPWVVGIAVTVVSGVRGITEEKVTVLNGRGDIIWEPVG